MRKTRDFCVFRCSITCMWAILPIREWRCQDIDQVLLHEIIFSLSVFSSSEELVKITSWFRVNCRLQLAGPGKKKRGNCEANLLYVEIKATSAPQTNHSQCSSPVEALNLVVESKSQPVELDNSTIGLHLPSRRKNSLQSYCSMDFDFCFNAIRYDLWFHVAWRLEFR